MRQGPLVVGKGVKGRILIRRTLMINQMDSDEDLPSCHQSGSSCTLSKYTYSLVIFSTAHLSLIRLLDVTLLFVDTNYSVSKDWCLVAGSVALECHWGRCCLSFFILYCQCQWQLSESPAVLLCTPAAREDFKLIIETLPVSFSGLITHTWLIELGTNVTKCESVLHRRKHGERFLESTEFHTVQIHNYLHGTPLQLIIAMGDGAQITF